MFRISQVVFGLALLAAAPAPVASLFGRGATAVAYAAGRVCGDGVCDSSQEACKSCPEDCCASTRLTAPFQVFDKSGSRRTCGQLSSKKDAEGGYKWQLRNCQALFDLIVALECGNKELDDGEDCDASAKESGCSAGEVCGEQCKCVTPEPVCGDGTKHADEACDASAKNSGCSAGEVCSSRCDECVPASPPTPVGLTDCPAGTIDVSNQILGSPTQHGVDWAPIGDGETQIYCYKIVNPRWSLQIFISDRTGTAQCTWGTYELIGPPAVANQNQTQTGRGAGFRVQQPVAGVYMVKITQAVTPNCADRYRVNFVG